MTARPWRSRIHGQVPSRLRGRVLASLVLGGMAGCWGATGGVARSASGETMPPPPPQQLTAPSAVVAQSGAPTETQFQNVDFQVASGIVLRIRELRGQMASKQHGQPVIFDDKRSFILQIDTADVALSMASLGHLMNDHVFAYHGAPLRALRFSTRNGQLAMSGVLHKVVDIPFQITATPTITDSGMIRIHPTAIRIFDVDGAGLMRALDITLSKLLDLRRAQGVTVIGNDLILDPLRILPPPSIQGRVVALRVAGNELVQVFGGAAGRRRVAPLTPPDSAAPNYMFFFGGTLRFGKLFMVQADMQIVDEDARDPFDFSIDEYNRQLVAGYSKNQPDMGLVVFMPDLAEAPPLPRIGVRGPN